MQFWNAYFPTEIILSLKSILLRFEQLLKEYLPIQLIMPSLLILVRLKQPQNASSPIVFTLSGILNEVSLLPTEDFTIFTVKVSVYRFVGLILGAYLYIDKI